MGIAEKFKYWSAEIKKEYIISGVIQAKRLVESAFAKHFPEAYKIINSEYPGKFRETIYSILTDTDEFPKCPVCGKDLPLRNYVKGFQTACSKECSYKYLHLDEITSKIRNTRKSSGNDMTANHFYWLGDYKVERDKSDRNYIIIHNYCKHGDVRCFAKTAEHQHNIGDVTHCIQCNRELYETYVPTEEDINEFINDFAEFYKKYSMSMNMKWWILYYPKKLKIIKTYYERYFSTFDESDTNCIKEAYYVFLHKLTERPVCKAEGCMNHTVFEPSINSYSVFCPNHMTGYNSSGDELNIKQFIDTMGIRYTHNERNVINGELDFYFPEHSLAIEYNGCWYHSSKFKDPGYHTRKYNECLGKGIQLLSIWEDSWNNKQDIVKSLICSKFGVFNHKIGARWCEVKEVSVKESREFLETNHLQGYCNAKWRYGLYYNGELVSMLTFGPSRFKAGETELLRACTKTGYSVSGGMSRMFKRFITDTNTESIVSYADCDISVGNLYKVLGFDYCGTTANWSWLKNGRRINRFNKIRLNSEGLYKCYGSGTAKYIWHRQIA